ncbi:MAG: hypothetical protein JNK35_14260 [Phycisphaerae bacterium]|nr:hypothetical protein [Phycisphaerae bacterium]
MGWIQYPSKATIRDGLRTADPGAAEAARVLADLILAHLERRGDPEALSGMLYSALTRAAGKATPDGKAPSKFDLLVLAKVHGDIITDLATAMVVFVSREQEGQTIDGEALERGLRGAVAGLIS